MGLRLLNTEKKQWCFLINFSFGNYLFSILQPWVNFDVLTDFSSRKKDLRKLSCKRKRFQIVHYSWNVLNVNLSSSQRRFTLSRAKTRVFSFLIPKPLEVLRWKLGAVNKVALKTLFLLESHIFAASAHAWITLFETVMFTDQLFGILKQLLGFSV